MTDEKTSAMRLIRRKKKKNIIHEIYLYDHTLVKRFVKTAPLPDVRKPWQVEHTALRRLSGLPVPATYGFSVKRMNGATEIVYAREYLDGSQVTTFGLEDMDAMAKMTAQVHLRGVITRDPSVENFIRTPDGKILFIDFGRSIILNPKNPLIIDYMGKELARIRHHAFADNDLLFNRFREKYFENLSWGSARRFMMEKISYKWYRFLMT